MVDRTQLPHLLDLLDDESPVVREAVVQELKAFGASLVEEIDDLHIELTDRQRHLLRSLVTDESATWLRETWPSWFECSEDKEKLEKALSLLSAFQNGPERELEVSSMLDELGEEFRDHRVPCSAETLAEFLFREKGLSGAREDYYQPSNSDLAFVMREGRGIPISLACIFMLVGQRLGLVIEGCSFPGHFLACTHDKGERRLVDCFDGGRFLSDTDIFSMARLHGIAEREVNHMLKEPTPAEQIVARVLSNLSMAYEQVGEPDRSQFMAELHRMLRDS